MASVTIIAAVSQNGVIGLHGRIPWHYPADLRRFKRLTLGGTVIMGRRTYESLGRPLPSRRNLIVTRTPIFGVECFRSLVEAIHATRNPTWLIGGAQIYAEGMQYAEGIDLTVVPDCVEHPEATRFPDIDLTRFVKDRVSHNDEDPRLACLFYRQCL